MTLSFPEIFLIGLGLSMDCFAVALSFGAVSCLRWRDLLKVSAFFGFFQGMMPLIGWFIGESLSTLISSVDHWIAFAILSFIGAKMIVSAVSEQDKKSIDICKLPVLLSLSVATSIDALITGVTFGFIHVNILEAVLVIGLVTFLASILGAKLGEKTTFISGRWAEIAGGTVLILIGLKILAEHSGWI